MTDQSVEAAQVQTGKNCSKCGQWKLYSAFYRDRSRKDGFKHKCKECADIDTQTYRENNAEKVIEANRQYHETHREERREYARHYGQANKTRHLEQEQPRPGAPSTTLTAAVKGK